MPLSRDSRHPPTAHVSGDVATVSFKMVDGSKAVDVEYVHHNYTTGKLGEVIHVVFEPIRTKIEAVASAKYDAGESRNGKVTVKRTELG
jgi:hypothetical protein